MTKEHSPETTNYLTEQLDLEADFGSLVQQAKPAHKLNGHAPAETIAINPAPDIEREAIVAIDGDKPAPLDPPIIDPKDPVATARLLVARAHTAHKVQTLHHQQSVFLSWTGTRYREWAAEEVRANTYAFLEGALAHAKKGELIRFKPSVNAVSGVIDALRAVTQMDGETRQPSWLCPAAVNPPAHEVVACKNGLLHVPTGRLLPHTPNFFSSSALTYNFTPNAPEPKNWLKFLETIWGNDQESIDTLQDIFGYLLGTETDQQKLFLVVGPKRSGKGTIGRVLNTLLGEDSVISPTLASLQTQFGIAPLIGKSVALIADARLGSKAGDQQTIAERLLSISGEDKQTVDRKFLAAWSGKVGVRFLIMTNELPQIADASGALTSRFVVLTMTKSFYGKEDRGLTNRLLGEMPGILNWAIQGWRNLRKRGHFIQPQSSAAAIQDLEDLSSPTAAFLRDKCTRGHGTVGVDSLYAAWVDWCREQGREHSGTKQTFGRNLRAAIPELKIVQARDAGERVREYEGLELNEAYGNKDNYRSGPGFD